MIDTKVPEPVLWCRFWWWDRILSEENMVKENSFLPSELFHLLKDHVEQSSDNNKCYLSRQEAIDSFWQAREEYRKAGGK